MYVLSAGVFLLCWVPFFVFDSCRLVSSPRCVVFHLRSRHVTTGDTGARFCRAGFHSSCWIPPAAWSLLPGVFFHLRDHVTWPQVTQVRVSAVLGSVLHDQHHQRHLHPLRPVRQERGLSDRPDALLFLRVARLHEQLPESGHLHHLQHGIPSSI